MTSTSGTSSNFGHLDYPNIGMGLSSGSTSGYSRDVIDLAEKLKYQHECIMHQQFSDEFYLQYAKNMLTMTQNSKFDKILTSIDAVPDSDYAQYSYEEIITMSNNGVNIPAKVLAWAKAQQEADVIDYTIVSDNVEYNDVNSQDKETGESEVNKIRAEVKDNAIKSKKAQEDVEKDREKSRELTDTAITIARKQKSILQNNSIDKIKDMADEWKSLDKKKQEEGKLDASEEIKYKKLSKNLKQGGAVIDEIQKNSADLDEFLESIDTLTNDANEGLTTAQKTIDSAKNFSKLDDRLNIFHKVHAYKIAEKGSGLLEDALVNVNDTQLAYVAEKIGQDLLDIGNEGFHDVTNENTQEAVKFSVDYTTKVKHIENTLGIESSETISTQEEEVKESESETSSEAKEETPVANAPQTSVEPQEEQAPVANAPETSVEPQEEQAPVANAPETSVEPQEEQAPVANAPETSVEPEEETPVANAPQASVAPQEEEEETPVAKAPQASVAPQEEETPVAKAPQVSVAPQEETPVANVPQVSVAPQEEETPVAKAPEASVAPQEEEILVANAPEASVAPQEEETPVAKAPQVSVAPQEEEILVANAPEASVEPQEEQVNANAPEASVEPEEETLVVNTPELSVLPQEGQDIENSAIPQFSPAMTRAANNFPSEEPQEEQVNANAPEASVEPEEQTPVANVPQVSVAPQEEQPTIANAPQTSVEPQEEQAPVANAPQVSVEPQEEQAPVANAPEVSVEPQEEQAPIANAPQASVEPEEQTPVANAPETSVEPQEEQAPVANAPETSVEPQEEQAPVANAPETSVEPQEEQAPVANAPETSVEPQEEETLVANAPQVSVAPQEEETLVANAPQVSVAPQEETPVANAPQASIAPQEEQDIENLAISQFSPVMTRAATNFPSEEPQEEQVIANAPQASVEPQEEQAPVANAPEVSVEPEEETTLNTNNRVSETPEEAQPVYVSEDDITSDITNAAASGRSPQDILNFPVTTRSANIDTSTNNNVDGSNKTSQSDKTEKTAQKEKEQIEDTQKTMRALYGVNVDFTKAFVGAEVATAVGMGPASYIMQIALWGGIVAASVLDLLVKNLIVGKSSEIAENEVKNSADFVKSLDTSSKNIIAEHAKNIAEAKLISNEYKELNNQSIDYQYSMMQDQAKLVEAGEISADEVVEYPDPFMGDKQNLEAKLQGLSNKDSQKINTINGPLKNSEKIFKQSMKSNNDFAGLNDKLGDRSSNNNQLGDFIIVDTAIAQGLITIAIASLLVAGFFSNPMVAAWALALVKNAGLAATGVGAKLVSNQVDNRIDANNETFQDGQKSLMHDDKVKNDVRRITAKAAADKMGSIPVQQEQQTAQNVQQNNNSEQNDENENSQNNSSNNVTVPSPSVRKESDTRSGFDKSSLNSELDINNPNDVKKANEYAIAYTRNVNIYDEKSKAAASTNSNSASTDSNTTADIKLSRFNKDGAIDSSKRAKKVNAASSTQNGRKRR